MGRKGRTTPEGDEASERSWDFPSMDEVAAAGRKTGLLRSETDEPESAPEATGEEEEPAPAEEAEDEAPADEKEGDETPEVEEEAAIEVDGKRYTAAEIRELERGSLREQHFTNVMQAVRQRERELTEEKAELRKERQELLSLQRSLVHGKSDESVTEETPQEPAVAARLKELDTRIKKIDEFFETRAKEDQEAERNEVIASTFEDTFGTLVKKFKVPEKLVPVIRKLVIADDPDVDDPVSRKASPDVIKQSVERSFRTWVSRLSTEKKKQEAEVISALRKGSKALAPKPKAGPAKPPAKTPPGKSPFRRTEREGREWDSQEAIGEVIERHAELRSEG